MDRKTQTKVSKLISYVLRHRPDHLGLSLDPEGWVDADLLRLRIAEREAVAISAAALEALVAADEKQRYTLREGRIRASQGHTVKDVSAVDGTPRLPPDQLYHGTTRERWEQIAKAGGISRMARHHVHLSADQRTARTVGSRHRREQLLLLTIDAARMAAQGHAFLLSDNGVWLTDSVPLTYIRPLEDKSEA